MSRLKIILSILFLSLGIKNSIAQQNPIHEIESFSTDIFGFISKLNNEIDSFFVEEKAQKLYRNLSYFKTDLGQYLKIRKNLMDRLNYTNYDAHDSEAKETVSKLYKELGKLTNRLNDIRPYVSSSLSSDAETIIESINQSQQVQRTLYLTELEKLFAGRVIDKVRLKKDGAAIYDVLVQCVGLVSSIQFKLKSKFKL